MDCAKIKGLLSEYIDGALDAQTKADVEDHLSVCKDCSGELASLKAYVGEMRALKQVKAPGDFLEKVHTRIKRRFEFERIIRKLFVPARVKVPRQLVAVAAMLFLVIGVFNIIYLRKGTQERLAYMPAVSERATLAKKPVEKHIELAKRPAKGPIAADLARKNKFVLEKEAAKPDLKIVSGFVVSPPIKEEKPIELVLWLKPQEPVRTYTNAELREEAVSYGVYDRMAAKDIEGIDQIAGAPSAEVPMARKRAMSPLPSPPYLSNVLLGVNRLIELAEGKVLSVEYEKDTNLPQFLNAEIPARNYGIFLEKLGQFGQLQEPLPSITAEDRESIQVRIGIILSK